MKKIISLFQRNYDGNRLVRDEVVPGAEWVLAGEGVATEKYDGSCCLWKDGRFWRRHDRKINRRSGKRKPAPEGWVACEPGPDPNTNHWPGWVPVGAGPEDKWFRAGMHMTVTREGHTYELVGPNVQGNPYGLRVHTLWPHGDELMDLGPGRAFEAIRTYLRDADNMEGIVWWHSDGRKVKIKRRDFGFSWPLTGPASTDEEAV